MPAPAAFRRLAAFALIGAAPLAAQPAPPPAPEGGGALGGEEEIVVTAGRALRGAVPGDVAPVLSLGPADIRGYGVSSISDLVAALGPQLRSTRGGPPVILLEGQRISGFQEVRDIPSEAIARVDVLPEEAALRYGLPADARVLNIVLVPRFRAVTAEVEGGQATEGGARGGEAELGYLRIRNGGRLNVTAEASGTGGLTEAQRGVVPPARAVGQAAFRSLTPDTQSYSLNTVFARTLGTTGLTLNGRAQQTLSDRMLGLGAAGSVLMQDVKTLDLHGGVTLNGAVSGWRWSFTGAYDRVDTRTDTDLAGGASRARGLSSVGQASLLVNGRLLALPAGDLTVSLQGGGTLSRFSSETVRAGQSIAVDLARDAANGQVSFDLPIASTRNDVLAGLGDLGLNANVAINRLSDFGTLTSYGGGLNWRPAEGVRLLVNHSSSRLAPTVQQLGNPLIATPATPVFDPFTGQTVLVTQLTGGNPGLAASTAHSWKVSASWQPIKDRDLTVSADYLRTRTRDPVQAFPVGVAALAIAFPERFDRDEDGRLTGVDARPINFRAVNEDQLRWGVNLFKPLASKLPKPPQGWRPPWVAAAIADARARGIAIPGDAAPPGAAGPLAGAGAAGGGPGGGPGGGSPRGRGGPFGMQGGGRLNLSLYHSWIFGSTVTPRTGVPVIDLLDGGSITGSGGRSRHQIDAQFGWFRDGWGVRATAAWQSPTRVDGVPGVPASQLAFGGLATVGLRLFYQPQADWRIMDAHPWLRGTRLSVNVSNLFNSRQRVTDASGAVPAAYQPGYLDPVGRRFTISIRKLFIPRPRLDGGSFRVPPR